MKTSTIHSVYEKPQQTYRGLRTIITQDEPPDEIVVVDDGSKNKPNYSVIKRLCTERDIDFKYIELTDHPEPRISCYPRNVGFKQSTGDVVIFIEPEMLNVGNTIKKAKEKTSSDPRYTVLGSQVWTIQRKIAEKLDDDDYKSPQNILNHEYAMLSTDPNVGNSKAPNSDWAITGQNSCPAGCFIALKRKWFEDIGGWDEDFEGHGWDDFCLYERLKLYGKGVKMHNDIVVIHQWHEKNYPYNIYEMAERNGKKSKERIKKGEYRANIGEEWGKWK